MDLKLTVSNDDQLREWLKDLIKGQIKSVIREELSLMIKDISEKKIESAASFSNIEKTINDLINKEVSKALKLNAYGENFITKVARDLITEKVSSVLKQI